MRYLRSTYILFQCLSTNEIHHSNTEGYILGKQTKVTFGLPSRMLANKTNLHALLPKRGQHWCVSWGTHFHSLFVVYYIDRL